MWRYLYLNFDGVLHHHDVYLVHRRPVCGAGQLFAHCALLIPVLAEWADLRIVLEQFLGKGERLRKSKEATAGRNPTSRHWGNLAQRNAGPARNNGMYWTQGQSEYAFSRLSRYANCAGVERRGAVRWLALDDEDEGWPNEARLRLVHCEPILGLAEDGKIAELRVRLAEL